MSKKQPNTSSLYSQCAYLLDEFPNLPSFHHLSSKKQNHAIKNIIIKVFGKKASKIKKWSGILKKYILCTLRSQNNVKLHGINTICSYIPSNQDKYSSNNFENNSDMEEEALKNKYIYNYKTISATNSNNNNNINDDDAKYEIDICSSDFEPFRNLICVDENQSPCKKMIQENYDSYIENMPENIYQQENQTELAEIKHHIYPPYSEGGCRDSEYGNCD